MPEHGERKTINGKDYEWHATDNGGGFWSQIRAIEMSGALAMFCDKCTTIRGVSKNQRTVLANYNLFIYKAFDMCNECFEYVNKHKEKLQEEFEKLELKKKQRNGE